MGWKRRARCACPLTVKGRLLHGRLHVALAAAATQAQRACAPVTHGATNGGDPVGAFVPPPTTAEQNLQSQTLAAHMPRGLARTPTCRA